MKKSGRIAVLHITNWFPNEHNPLEAIWIDRHIRALNPFTENYVLHLQVIGANKFRYVNKKADRFEQLIFSIPFKSWFLIELLTAFFLVHKLFLLKANRRFDIINFHIAYPLLVYWHIIRRFVKLPIVVTEHWSAYHYNFNLPKSDSLRRIKRIFHQGIPVIAVSRSLAMDIQNFSSKFDFPFHIVPNIVDESKFVSKSTDGSTNNSESYFFMLGLWKWPKNPFVVIRAFAAFSVNNHIKLKIGGFGPQWGAIYELVNQLNLSHRVELLGKLNPDEVGEHLADSLALLHPSEYETFSVVCAEAVSCGVPVIASKVGAIPDFISDANGYLVKHNTIDCWLVALNSCKTQEWDRKKIQEQAKELFSEGVIGRKYYEILHRIWKAAVNDQ